MKFLFDFDETLVIGDMIKIVSESLYIDGSIDRVYSNQDLLEYSTTDLPAALQEDLSTAFQKPEFVWVKTVMPGTYALLMALEALGHQTGILTARTINIREETIKYLHVNFPRVKFALGINFCNVTNDTNFDTSPSKLGILKEIQPDYYFDDHIKYCLQAQSIGITTFLVSNKHTPWNHKEVLPAGITRIKNAAFLNPKIIWNN